MASRKRIAGQARRKAKASANIILHQGSCSHGYIVPSSHQHIMHNIIKTLFVEVSRVRADAIKRQISFTEGAILVMREMVRMHSKILSDDTVKSSLEAYFLFQGAGNLVQFNYSDTKDDGARFNTGNIMAACYILLNEYQTDYAQWGCSKHEKELMKYEECFGRGSLCILMIFSNRIPCSCLDKKCEEVWS
mmetsp:Transcript_26343/g.55613  ORF Transcript_26343/g.55613 Transcript_26343/m.55613 type:complete len:191 (+) Transcript_26343:129-701(+)